MGRDTEQRPNDTHSITILIGGSDTVDVAFLKLRLAELERENEELKSKLRSMAWRAIQKFW